MSEPLSFLIKSAFDATGATAAMNSISSMDRQITVVGRNFTKFMGLLGAGGIGASLFAFGKSAVMEFAKSQAAVGMLTKAMQNLGNFTKQDIKIQTDFAAALQKTTKYTDEQIMAIQTQLVTYGLHGDKLKAATVATLDLAVKTGSTETAAKLMGKAFQGQTDTLARYGLKIGDNIAGAEKFNEVLRLVQARMGGFAEAEGKTFEGQLIRLKNRFGELQEKIGNELMPVATTWLSWAEKATTAVEKLGDKLAGPTGYISALPNLLKKHKEIADIVALHLKYEMKIPEALKARLAQMEKVIEQTKKFEAERTKPPAPGKPMLPGPEVDEAFAKFMSPEAQMKRLDELVKNEQDAQNTIKEYDRFVLSDRGQMYARFFGQQTMDSARTRVAQETDARKMAEVQKDVLRNLELRYAEAGKTFSGGFRQAFDEMGSNLVNWKDNFNQVIGASIGPATEAFKEFFNMSASGWMNFGKLAEGVFRGIRDAFYNMLMQMAAKAAVYGFLTLLFPGSALAAGGLSKFLGFDKGGLIPGAAGAPQMILAHGGEYVLPASVVSAIKAGQAPSGAPRMAAAGAGAGAGANINFSQPITITGGVSGGNVRDICRQIAEAGRQGVTEALDAAKVLYKQGAKRSGETTL